MRATMGNNGKAVHIAICIIIAIILVVCGWFLSEQNRINEEKRKDPENIIGSTIGEIYEKYCSQSGVKYSHFFISNREFDCYDLGDSFFYSDMDNYILYSYTYMYNGDGYFKFNVDTTQIDIRPLEISDPKQFIGKMATSLCPKYSLADFKIYAAGEHMGISTVPCKDINQYSMYRDVIITDAYYGADVRNGDNPDEYFEENNAEGTRKLYFDGEFLNDRLMYK